MDFVRTHGSDQVWKVNAGSGMGLRHSGPTADAAFYCRVERDWATTPTIMRTYKVLEYIRYKDDIWVLVEDVQLFRCFFHEFRRRAGYFRVKLEEASSIATDMLEVRVFKNHQTKRFEAVPRFKESNLGIPLCVTSAHARTVHLWPLARVKDFHRISSTRAGAEHAKSIFIQRFLDYHAPAALIRLLQAVNPWNPGRRRLQPSTRPIVWWLPIGYHPAWLYSHIARRVAEFAENPRFRLYLVQVFPQRMLPDRVRVSWRNELPYMCDIVQK